MSESRTGSARIFLVDDHPAVRTGLSLLFGQTGHTVVGDAGTVAETLKKLDRAKPDIVLVDLALDNESGFDLLEELHRREIKSVVYSVHCDAETIERAFKAGAKGYVTKRDHTDSLAEAIDGVLANRSYVSARAAQSVAEKFLTVTADKSDAILSDREQTIFEHLQQGKTTAEIALELNISPRTVGSYYARMIEKLKLNGMKSLRRYALDKHKGK